MAGQDNEKTVHDEQIEAGGANYDDHGQGGLSGKALKEEALLGQQNEHNLGLWQALKTYKRAALWSVCE
jgi:SP family general alpha glucoside:H+ symporter-like MFS transporter